MSKVFRQHHGESQWPRPAETPYAENGTYGVVGGRGLVTPSYPIIEYFTSIILFLEKVEEKIPHDFASVNVTAVIFSGYNLKS